MTKTKKIVFLTILFLIAVTAVFIPAAAVDTPYAATYLSGAVTVENTDGGYIYSDEKGNTFSASSLQEIANSVSANSTVFFKNVTSVSGVTFSVSSVGIQGEIGFTLSDGYGITLADGCHATFGNAIIRSDKGGVAVGKNARFVFSGGEIVCNNDTDKSFSALKVSGYAEINDGIIEYKGDSFGYGISVTDGSARLTINETNAVKITGSDALCVMTGSATINGGTFDATKSPLSERSSVDVYNDSTTEINGGIFNYPVRHKGSVKTTLNVSSSVSVTVIVSAAGNNSFSVGNTVVRSSDKKSTAFTVDNGTVAIGKDKDTISGYRVTGFVADGVPYDNKFSFSVSDGYSEVVPATSDEYYVTLVSEDNLFSFFTAKYNSVVTLSSLPTPTKKGYDFLCWAERDGDFLVDDDITLTAKFTLSAPEIRLSDIEFDYDGVTRTLSPEVSHPLSTEFTYRWERLSDGIKSTDLAYSVTAVADSGTYVFSATVSADGFTAERTVQISVKINRSVAPDRPHTPFTVTLVSEDNLFSFFTAKYNSVVTLSSLPTPTKKGYDFLCWAERDGDFLVDDDITLTAKFTLSAPEIRLSDIEFDYDGVTRTLSPEVSHPLSTEFTYRWERLSDGIKSTDLAYSVTAVADSGTYVFSATVSADGFTAERTVQISVKINRSVAPDRPHTPFTGVYDPQKTLSSYALEGGYRWKNPTDIPVVSTISYAAYYNPDGNNYSDRELTIDINLDKATETNVPVHKKLTGVYDAQKTLADYELQKNFYFSDETIVPTVKATEYDAYYNRDRENYYDYNLKISLTLTKGTYDDTVILAKTTFPYGKFKSLAELQNYMAADKVYDGYRLNYTKFLLDTTSLAAGENLLDCVYNLDSDNYENKYFSWTVVVTKATYSPAEVAAVPTITGVYGEKTLADYELPADYFWVDETITPTVNVTEYSAYYNSSPDNYENFYLTVTIILEKAFYNLSDITLPNLAPVVYAPSKTLAEIILPENFSWVTPTAVPTVNVSSYKAIFCVDPTNYMPTEVNVPLTVNKAACPTVTFNDATVTYDGETHGVYAENVLYPLTVTGYLNNEKVNAGRYAAIAFISQSDKENYTLTDEQITAYLTIKKAPSVITVTEKIYLLKGNDLTVSGGVNNAEQSLIVPLFDSSVAGEYSVVIKTSESANYLAGEAAIKVIVNDRDLVAGSFSYPDNYDGTYFYGIIGDYDTGIPAGSEAVLTRKQLSKTKSELYLFVNGAEQGKTLRVKLLLPDDMRNGKLTLSDDSGTIDYKTEDAVYLTFEIKNGSSVTIDFASEKDFVWWWIPVAIGVIIIAAAILSLLIMKGKIRLPAKKKEKTNALRSNDESNENQTK